MFVTITLITLALVAYLTLRDWIFTPKLSQATVQKRLKSASQHVLLGNWVEARDEIDPLLESGQGGKECALIHVQVLRGTRAFEHALKKVSDAARQYPEELLFRMEEGLILLGMDRANEALAAFKVCAPIMRTESDALALGAALNRAGYHDQALDMLGPWLKTTENGELLALVGEIYYEKNQFHEAVAHAYHAFKAGHQTHKLFVQWAHAYRRLGNLAEAEKIFRRLLDKDATDITATLGLGACMQERGHHHKALLVYQSSGAWEHKDIRLLKEAGLCALHVKKYTYAEHYLRDVMQRCEPEAPTYASYALALEGQQKWQEAEQIYLRIIQLFPADPSGYRALAWMFGVGLTGTLSNEQGLNYAHVALNVKNDPVSWEILSACEARVGNFERAYQIQMTLSAQDNDPEARTRRQRALRILRKNHPLEGQHVTRSLVA